MKGIILKNYQQIIHDIHQMDPKIHLVAISKFQPLDKIRPLLLAGHKIFGESRLEEAIQKWANVKEEFSNIELHFIGKIQSNKIKKIVDFFDVIESVDSIQHLVKIAEYASSIQKIVKVFIQINIGEEPQKSGILLNELDSLYQETIKHPSIRLEGFMCIPPNTTKVNPYFQKMNDIRMLYGDLKLSMGMSHDYKIAITHGSNYIRVGSALFGQRPNI